MLFQYSEYVLVAYATHKLYANFISIFLMHLPVSVAPVVAVLVAVVVAVAVAAVVVEF